ncbi:MAG: cation:proton antiporter regulatory subunit [Sedimentibacter sp.]
MGLIGAVLLFFLFILVYIMIAEIFTVLFRLTGLTEDKAKFQVVSMLTNSGYTTQESEVIATSKIRRKLARITMIFGYAFTVTIVSSVVNLFVAFKKTQMTYLIWIIVGLGFFIAALYLLQKSTRVKKSFNGTIERVGNRIMFGKKSNPIIILDTYGDVVMAEVFLTHVPLILENIMLEQTELKSKYNINILLIKRSDTIINNIKGETIVEQDDTLVVFGTRKNIRAVFEKVEEHETDSKNSGH